MSLKFFSALAFSALVATAALAAPSLSTVKTAKGEVLAGEKGMTLYTFKKDTTGVSNCYDKCEMNWPPLLAAADAKADGDYSLVKRKDGTLQWAKGGMPLYYWIKDQKQGDITGDGFMGVWELARP